MDGVDVKRYFIGWSGQFIKYGENLSCPRKPELFKGERILVGQIPSSPPYSILGTFVDENLVNDNNSMIVTIKKSEFDLKYILALLNSKLISFWFIKIFAKLHRKIFPQFKVYELSLFPIKASDKFQQPLKNLANHIIQELKKQKINLSLKQQDEWQDYFNDYKQKIIDLKGQIDQTDRDK